MNFLIYYQKSHIAKTYTVLQVGFTFFIKGENGLIAHPYNFYVFPRQSAKLNPKISLQAGCVEFNSKNKMDWNRWIEKGISYAKMSELKYMKSEPKSLYEFTILFEKVWNSGKPLIGHNCYQDILYIYESFVAHLPENYQ